MLCGTVALPGETAEEPRTAAAGARYVQRLRQQDRAALRRPRSGLHQPKIRTNPLRGRRHSIPLTRILDLHVPSGETLSIRLRQIITSKVTIDIISLLSIPSLIQLFSP